MHAGQNQAMRADVSIFRNYNLPAKVAILSRPPVKMSKYRGSQSNGHVVAESDLIGMVLINIHKLADPGASADFDSSQLVQARPKAVSTWSYVCDFVQYSIKQMKCH
jgi:hypothetical protein